MMQTKWIEAFNTGRAVTQDDAGFNVIDLAMLEPEDGEALIATYHERWKAENHAITGCPCMMNAHYYGIGCDRR